MKPHDELTVLPDATDSDGRAVATTGGIRVAIGGGIPGERVRVRVTSVRGRDALATVVGIVDPAPARVVPRCRHAVECGGCAWQHIAYAEQLRLKQAQLTALLTASLGPGKATVAPMIGMTTGADGMPWAFRHKVSFVFAPDSKGSRMGHFARGSTRVLAIDECPVHSERGNRIAFALRDRLQRAQIPAAGPDLEGILRRVVVRTTADESEAVALLVVTENDKRLRTPVRSFLKGDSAPESFAVSEQDRPDIDAPGRKTLKLAGTGQIRERALGPSFLVSPDAFFQTNVEAARHLVELVVNAAGQVGAGSVAAGLSPRGKVLDLYAGSGLFALPLALAGHHVVAVEENRQAVRDAETNRRINRVAEGRMRLLAMRVEDALDRLSLDSFDTVVLDPPRQGCPDRVLQGILTELEPRQIVYVSCNPHALAADLPKLVAAGYGIDALQPVDMFPHTPHIETVAVLTRQ